MTEHSHSNANYSHRGNNSDRPHQADWYAPDGVQRDDILRYDIDRDGGLYDQARAMDSEETRLAQERTDNQHILAQQEAYDSYKDNIKFTQQRERHEAWQEVKQDMRESLDDAGRASKKVARAAGHAVLREVMPLATEFMQRRNMNVRRRNQYKAKHKPLSLDDRYVQNKQAFTGSVEDFKTIRREGRAKAEAEKEVKQQKRAEAGGHDTWEDYQAASKERTERRRKNVRDAVKKSLPLWFNKG